MRESGKYGTYAQDFLSQNEKRVEVLGQRAFDCYGTEYRYSKNGATALTPGTQLARAAVVANHLNCSVAAAAGIGATRVSVTLGATALTEDYYKDGTLNINAGTGLGNQYRIKGHPAADSGGTVWIELVDTIRVALVATTSKASLHANKFSGVTISSSINANLAGVSPIAVTANYYFWAIVDGDHPVLQSGTESVGTMMIPHTTDGALGTLASSVDVDAPIAGIQVTTGVSGEYQLVDLKQ